MSELPSNIKAAKFRDEGSDFYRQNKFFDALVCYNISLCFSETNEEKSLAFANRSAVYIESKKFQQCLDNIQLAREHGYPADKISKLDAREAKCKELMEQHRPDPREDPWNFFKLSYPANKKLPFMVDCLELREDTKYGRHIITNRDLKAGDIIAIDDPFFKFLDLAHCYERCNNCLTANMLSLIPCKGRCINTMFCSEKCAKAAESRHRQHECSKNLDDSEILVQKLCVDSMKIAGGIKELQACIEEHKKLTIFDIDMANPGDPLVKKKQLMAFLALMPRPEESDEQDKVAIEDFARVCCRNLCENPGELELLVQMSQKLVRIKTLNSHSFCSLIFSDWKPAKIGQVISLLGALFNHSCDPNVNWISVNNKFVAVVHAPIKAGAQLFICYKHSCITYPLRDERREIILEECHFHCECNACNDLELDEMQKTYANFKPLFSSLFSLSPNPIKEFNKNCKYLEGNFKNHPCQETIISIIRNACLIEQIAQLGSLKQ